MTDHEQNVPPELVDLVRFLCESWGDIDDWAYQHCTDEALSQYPLIQGASTQAKIRHIGIQQYDVAKIQAALRWMMAHDDD